jgi:hypothetical protein
MTPWHSSETIERNPHWVPLDADAAINAEGESCSPDPDRGTTDRTRCPADRPGTAGGICG